MRAKSFSLGKRLSHRSDSSPLEVKKNSFHSNTTHEIGDEHLGIFSFAKKSFKLDKTKYIINFESVFIKHEVGDQFQAYLKTEFNEEPLKFLRAVRELKNSKENPSNMIESVKSILKLYIVDGAPFEVNISFKMKDQLLQDFKPQEKEEDWILSIKPHELFKKVAKVVQEELFHDNWKRFIRTEVADKIIEKYYDNKDVCMLKIVEEFPFDDDHFRHPYVEDKDFDFAKIVMEDNSDWELIGTKVENKVNTFFSNITYLPKVCYGKNAVSIKYECILPYSLDRCCLGYLTNQSLKASDPNTMHIETHKYLTREQIVEIYKENGKFDAIKKYETNLTINTGYITFGFPFNPRIFEYGGAYHYDPKLRVLTTILKCYFDPNTTSLQSYKRDAYVSKNGKIATNTKCYPLFEYMITVYKEIDEKKVLFSQVNVVDGSGWSNSETLAKLLAKARGLELRNTLHKMASEFYEDATIEDYKDELCAEIDGKVVNGLGKLLYDTQINKQKAEEFKLQMDEMLKDVETVEVDLL